MTALPGDFTFITTCKGRLEHLKQSLPRMCAQNGAKVVVVDYACPDGTADWVRSNFPNVKVVQETDDPAFKLSRARNMGAAVASTPWIMFIDADMLVEREFLTRVLPLLETGRYFRAAPWSKQNWGNVICSRDAFLKSAGYDEVYCGWSVEDDDFYDALELQGQRRSQFPAALMPEIEHTNELRTKFHVMSMVTSHRINMIYRQIKTDLMNIFRSPLPLDERRRIYDQVKSCVATLEKGSQPSATFRLRMPDLVPNSPPSIPAEEAGFTRLTRALQYEITLDDFARNRKSMTST